MISKVLCFGWLTTNKRSAFCNHVEFLGFKLVSNGPTSSKLPIPTPEAPYVLWKNNELKKKNIRDFWVSWGYEQFCFLGFLYSLISCIFLIKYLQVHLGAREWLAMALRDLQLCKDSYKATRTCGLLWNRIKQSNNKQSMNTKFSWHFLMQYQNERTRKMEERMKIRTDLLTGSDFNIAPVL